MFFVLKYGNKEEMLFNSNCSIRVLLENIKKRCKLASDIIIDLADEKANVMGLSDQPDMKYACLVLQPRQSYILIQATLSAHEKTKDVRKIYIPLLKSKEETSAEFLEKLNSTKPKHGEVWKSTVSKVLTRSGKKRRT